MAVFSDKTIKEGWQRAEGKCECRLVFHEHIGGRCGKTLVWKNRGKDAEGGWEAFCRSKICVDDELWNLEILCWQCYQEAIK